MQNAKCKIADETVTIYKETGNGASRSFFITSVFGVDKNIIK